MNDRLIRAVMLAVIGLVSGTGRGDEPSDTSATIRATLVGHSARVQAVAFSPDGQTIASAGNDGSIIFWDVAEGKARAELPGHAARVNSIAFSPTDELLASASADRTVKLWRISSGDAWRTLDGHAQSALSVAFSPDGSTLASTDQEGAIHLWNVADGRAIRTWTGHRFAALSVAFAPDGDMLVSGGQDALVKTWNVQSGALVSTLRGHAGWVNRVAYSPSGTMIASASNDGSIKLWDLESEQLRSTLTEHQLAVADVAFAADGRFLFSGGSDRQIRIWDVASGDNLAAVPGHRGWLSAVACSPTQLVLASTGSDRAIRLWDIRRPALQQAMADTEPEPPDDKPPAVDFALEFDGEKSFVEIPDQLRYDGTHPITMEAYATPISANPTNLPDTPHVAHAFSSIVANTHSGGVDLQVVEDGFKFQLHNGNGYLGVLSPESPFAHGRVHVAGVFDMQQLRLYVNGKLVQSTQFQGQYRPSPLTFMIGANPSTAESRIHGPFRGIIDEVRISRSARYTSDFTPDTRFQADANTMALYHFDEGEGNVTKDASGNGLHGRIQGAQWVVVKRVDNDTSATSQGVHAPVSPVNNENSAVADARDAASHRPPVVPPASVMTITRSAATLLGHQGNVTCLDFAPDNKSLASAGIDQQIVLWDVASGRRRQTLDGHTQPAWAVRYSPDGTTLASAALDRTVRLWDVESGELKRISRGHQHSVWTLAPDGKKLASGSEDKTIRIWEVDSGKVLAVLVGHSEIVRCLAFSALGKCTLSMNLSGCRRDARDVRPCHHSPSRSAQPSPPINGVRVNPRGDGL